MGSNPTLSAATPPTLHVGVHGSKAEIVVAASQAYRNLGRLPGQVAFSIDLEELREDRA